MSPHLRTDDEELSVNLYSCVKLRAFRDVADSLLGNVAVLSGSCHLIQHMN